MLLGSEQQDARIGGQYRTVLGLEKVTRILADEDQAPAVLPDPAGQTDEEPPHRFMLEEQTDLVDQQMSGATLAAERGPQPVGQNQECRRDELLAQVADVEADDRGAEIDVCRCAEHAPQITGHPAAEDGADPRSGLGPLQLTPDIPEHRRAGAVPDHRPDRRLPLSSLRL